VSIPLAPYFQLKVTMYPTIVEEREYISHVPYASVVGSLICAMICTRSNLSQSISMVSRYTHDPGWGSLGGSEVDSTIHQRYHRCWFDG